MNSRFQEARVIKGVIAKQNVLQRSVHAKLQEHFAIQNVTAVYLAQINNFNFNNNDRY